MKKKKKPEPFLTGFLLETDSINPKFLVKQEPKEVKKVQNIPKVVMDNKPKDNEPKNRVINEINDFPQRNEQNQQNNNSQQAKDINDIFDLFSNSVNVNEQKKPIDNPNSNMNNNNNNPNFIDINANNNKQQDNNPQNNKLNSLEEMLKNAYANNPNQNQNNNNNFDNNNNVSLKLNFNKIYKKYKNLELLKFSFRIL